MINIPGDDKRGTMRNNGYIVGFNFHRVIWAFGFVDGSPQARAFDLSMTGPSPLWVMASRRGRVEASFSGPQMNLPLTFKKVLG